MWYNLLKPETCRVYSFSVNTHRKLSVCVKMDFTKKKKRKKMDFTFSWYRGKNESCRWLDCRVNLLPLVAGTGAKCFFNHLNTIWTGKWSKLNYSPGHYFYELGEGTQWPTEIEILRQIYCPDLWNHPPITSSEMAPETLSLPRQQ